MKQLLAPHHFHTPERPKEQDFGVLEFAGTNSLGGKFLDEVRFKKALSEWESLYGDKPEPEWIDFKSAFPEHEQQVFTRNKSNNGFYEARRWNGDNMNPLYFISSHVWADAESHGLRLAEWEYHQVRYKGWKFDGYWWSFENKNAQYFALLNFDNGIELQIYDDPETCRFSCECHDISIAAFELICEENGIEL